MTPTEAQLGVAIRNAEIISGAYERALRLDAAVKKAMSPECSFAQQAPVAGLVKSFIQKPPAAAATFLAREASVTIEDGWGWRVKVLQAGWATGTVMEGGEPVGDPLPQYYPPKIVEQIAKLLNGARFRSRHPRHGTGAEEPELTVGVMTEGRMEGDAAFATVRLLYSGKDVRAQLLAAQEAGRLDLFGISMFAHFDFEKTQIDGVPARLATNLRRLVAVDMVAEAGAGGCFLGDASHKEAAGISK